MSENSSVPKGYFNAPIPRSYKKDRLCDVCVEIDFGRFLGEKIEQSKELGTWSRIFRSTRCPFCRLVTYSLQSAHRRNHAHPNTLIFLNNGLSWKLGNELSRYDHSKSESYSNKFDLRSRAKRCSNDAYRYVVLTEDEEDTDHEIEKTRTCIQYLACMEKDVDDQQFFGRRVPAGKVDMNLLEPWLERCARCHYDECKGEKSEQLPPSLRLIDVKQMCILKAPQDNTLEYVALSYIWGTEQMKESTGMVPAILKRENIVRSGDEELTPLPKRLPKTIVDAISLTRSLGYTYLWLNALRIVQNDPFEEKALHLTRMKAIYSCASLTIAAAAGTHADHGLPGISVPRYHEQYIEIVDHLRFGAMFPSFSDLQNSYSLPWNTRGWTFQEKLHRGGFYFSQTTKSISNARKRFGLKKL